MLASGGQQQVDPTFTGTISKATIINDSAGAAYAMTVEMAVKEDPAATSQVTITASSQDTGSASLGTIGFAAFRAGELDNPTNGTYGFRGTFYLTKTGATSDANDILKYVTGGKINITYQAIPVKTVSM